MNKINKKQLGVFMSVFAVLGVASIMVTNAASVNIDLKAYYPNPNMYTNRYLEGFNYISGQPVRSVLWFEKQDQWTFRAYNSGPEDVNKRCNWDQLSWWDDGTLRYSKTHHECPGAVPNEIVYDSPIIFLPRYWKTGSSWKYNGTASAKYYENGQLRCSGTNTYTAEVVGKEQITPAEIGIHWRTTQTTTWDTGDVQGKCFTGYKTRWQEDYWLSDKLPKPNGGVAKGLKRSKGGNLDATTAQWDVWFDKWAILPGSQ